MIALKCDYCGSDFLRPTKEHSRSLREGRTKLFCSRACGRHASEKVSEIVIRKCLFCQKTFESTNSRDHKKCCSLICARTYSRSFVDPTNISDSMLKKSHIKEIECPICKKSFRPTREKKACSQSCSAKLRWKNDKSDIILSMKIGIEKSVKNGTWNVWRKRTGRSYPETIFEKVLQGHNIRYEYEKPVGRFSIDFALLDKKIALEIDGQQHSRPKNIESDHRKDILLESLGWKVYRIKWKGHSTEKTRLLTEKDVSDFLEFYNNFGGCGTA